MSNPTLLLLDSDVLTQVFIAKCHKVLLYLKAKYGVQAAVVAEVDMELRWLGRFHDRFVPQLDKTLERGALIKLDPTRFQSFLATAPAGASWNSFQSLGQQYMKQIQRGEAYTHAAGLTLQMPTASNDFRAIETLRAQGLALPTPVLRTFDLCAFGYDTGCFTEKECETFRKALLSEGEGIPKAFMNSSFVDGLKTFRQRLASAVPGCKASPPQNFSDVLTLISQEAVAQTAL